jgi:hypothetical protein
VRTGRGETAKEDENNLLVGFGKKIALIMSANFRLFGYQYRTHCVRGIGRHQQVHEKDSSTLASQHSFLHGCQLSLLCPLSSRWRHQRVPANCLNGRTATAAVSSNRQNVILVQCRQAEVLIPVEDRHISLFSSLAPLAIASTTPVLLPS